MIGESCFSGCNKLKFIYIPNSVSALYPFAFRSCPIEVISIPAGCIVYSKAFDGCTNLKSVEIFDNAIVRSNAFSRCTNISKIVVYEYVALYENSFEDIDSDVFYFGITDFCYPSTETELHRINGTHIFVRNEYVSDKYGKTKAVKCSSSTVSSNKCLCTPYYDNMQRIALRTQRRR
ncbi:hypothetical protein TVAG_488130 [Trichomonas vaginalis G3]|uniref:Surface antigen BspA-like n=1 Tax=Trichomonas vaginalis (strain ATCC PRA-98 / G3) TaxID=412133 RepID=A2E6K6_TRIV3|nr:protein kinase a regulatory subunit binding [Trichomonas vaginalis G3]EAY11711.1 hypothetical protein TVAG_488130 [Trichomonas vaginalis G3]KAI5488849.1 protein kinase a regulatory subunit binding [Trichomonas vaginalis G3]|eukprot:XP_001323934.1 hypothetical protein [Trichomonas vaginalis G3]